MVDEKKTKRERNIRSKLMAAIAMLLVSSIMMVSTTYAWFTLSTAPEVTGIQTAVGANGNLEMALLPAVDPLNPEKTETDAEGNETKSPNYFGSVTDAMAAIKTGSADSFDAANQTKPKANITWGNLVDLADASYGMSQIKLYPSTLNAPNGVVEEGNMLSIPVYGSDGRVADLASTGTTGTFNGVDSFYAGSGYGVRAVGKVSGLSARQQAYNTAMNKANSAAGRANTAASESLTIGGKSLAALAMKHAQNSTATFTDADLQGLLDTYTHLLGDKGAVTEIETSLRQYIIACVIQNSSDADYANAIAPLQTAELSALKGNVTALDTMIDKLAALRTKIENAKTTVEGLIAKEGDGGHTWTEIYPSVSGLGDTDSMMMNGKSLDYWLGNVDAENKPSNDGIRYAELVKIMNNVQLEIYGSGIYVEMADFCGKISNTVPLVLENVEQLGGEDFEIATNMTITPNKTPSYLSEARSGVPEFKADENSTVKNPISDYYGYIVDLAFRTNATDSYLKLQTEAEDRIYEGNTANTDTMGGGSTMSYSYYLENANYNGENLKKLMSGVRVVFFNPVDGKIMGYAKLDMTEGNFSQVEILDEADAVIGYTLVAKLKMTETDGGEFKTGTDADKLVDLNQNISTAVSALVYLDGYAIGNEAVSTTDITGTMNLQFSSSADLTPMDYSDLKNGTATENQNP